MLLVIHRAYYWCALSAPGTSTFQPGAESVGDALYARRSG